MDVIGGAHPNGPPPVVPSRNRSMTSTENPTSPKQSPQRQKVQASLSGSPDMWKHFSQMSLSENSLQETRASDIKKAKPRLPNFKPSKYSKDEAILIIQRAWRGALAMRKMIRRKKNQRTRLNIIKEMVDTETTYVATLETIFYQFELPLRALLSQEKQFITEDEMKTIFSSVEVILGFSSHLLQRLRERYEEWHDLPPAKQHVGDIFVEMTTYTKVYVSYVSNYEASTALCSSLRKKNEQFEQWEKEALSTLPGNHSSIGFLLITPVQRIPRYLMLVQTLLKATWEGHQDVSPLSDALESIKETAVIVDKRTAETERMQKISEIEDSIGGKFETLREAKRRYVMEGELDIVSDGKAGKMIRSTRYFFLFNDLLVVCKYAKMGSLRGSLKGSLKGKKGQKAGPILFEFRSRSWLATDEKVGSVVEKEAIEGITNVFEIALPSAKFIVAAGTEATKRKWIEELTAAFVDLEPKVQFKQDVAKKMSSEKAKRARALIAQQYAHMRVAEQRGEVEGEEGDGEGEGGEGEGLPQAGSSPMSNTRRFRAHRNDMTDMKMHENAQKAEEQINALMQEEQEIKDSREKEKKKKEEERKQALEDMKNRYRRESQMSDDSPIGREEKTPEKKKKKTRRTLALDDALSTPEAGSPKREKAEETPPPSPEAAPAPRKRAFRRLADETYTTPR